MVGEALRIAMVSLPKRPAKAARRTRAFPTIGMGASAGGLQALEQFFSQMPADSGMALVVVTHLDPSRASMMPELLGRVTKMKVRQVKNGMAVEPNSVLLIPPNKDMTIVDGTLRLSPPVLSHGIRLPIDGFFRSLAVDQGEQAIGIILSGNGADGTLGLKAIKENLGMVMVQEPGSAKYDGMPNSAIETGLADYVLPPDRMPPQLIQYAKRSQATGGSESAIADQAPDTLVRIFQALRTHTGHDFSQYKKNTVCRRIERRMAVHQIDSAATYLRLLQHNPQEVGLLFKELLIGVTSFFRDPDAFAVLRQKILPRFLADKPKDYVVRIWVPGCSTGEEVFSVAITVQECLEQLKHEVKMQIFGTDIDADAIDVARVAAYPTNFVADVSAERLRRFFTKEGDAYRIKRDLREMVVLAPQNLLRDPPFTKLDLLCCRNLLIYLDQELHKRLMPVFHYTLRPGGLLFLGSSESVGAFQEHFAVLDQKWKIYQRRESAVRTPGLADFAAQQKETDRGEPVREPARARQGLLAESVSSLLLAQHCPCCAIVNDADNVLYIHGRTGSFLEPASGQTNVNIVDMARPGLKFELAAAIRKARNQAQTVRHAGVRVESGNVVNLSVQMLQEPKNLRGLLMVVFEEVAAPRPQAPDKKKRGTGKRGRAEVGALEQELRHAREHLQTTIEELEASNEELKSTNEEMQSTNEELQSTNEEMETSKEEMHSLNEELATVNNELESKIEQLTQANNDMKNLLDSTHIATVFLDANLCVKRFTAESTKIFNLIASDVGRPIGHFVANLRYENLMADIGHVLADLTTHEARVFGKDGNPYWMRILPYRTTDNVIDGVVLTFVDVRDLQDKGAMYRFAQGFVQTAREPMLALDTELRVVAASRAFAEVFGGRTEAAEGRFVSELHDGAWSDPKLRELLVKIAAQGVPFKDFALERGSAGASPRQLLLHGHRITCPELDVAMVLLAIEDVSQNGGMRAKGDGA